MPRPTISGESQWQGNRTGKTLPELLANLFSTSSPHREIKSGWPKSLVFESEVVPDLKKRIKTILGKKE